MKKHSIAIVIVIVLLGAAFFPSHKAWNRVTDTSGLDGVPYVVVDHSYLVLIGVGTVKVKIESIYDSGIAIVTAEGEGEAIGIRKGTRWSLNLHQVLLMEQTVIKSEGKKP